MARTRLMRFQCGHAGCHEYTHYEYSHRDEAIRLQKDYANGKWRCSRHTKPEELLTPDNLMRASEIKAERKGDHLYWGFSGFIHGPGFKAFADDFPEGTILRVTAEIVLPDTQESR